MQFANGRTGTKYDSKESKVTFSKKKKKKREHALENADFPFPEEA